MVKVCKRFLFVIFRLTDCTIRQKSNSYLYKPKICAMGFATCKKSGIQSIHKNSEKKEKKKEYLAMEL